MDGSQSAARQTLMYARAAVTRLKDGEATVQKDVRREGGRHGHGHRYWGYKGADKGLTNLFTSPETSVIATARPDNLNAAAVHGCRKFVIPVDRAQFVLINEGGEAVVGGRDTIAAFRGDSERWRIRHKAPGRGTLRIVAGIALRATALYFRYGGLATSAIGLARSGLSLAGTVNSLRWSGLRSRFGSINLTTLASNSARNYVSGRIYSYGSFLEPHTSPCRRSACLTHHRPVDDYRRCTGRALPSRADVQEIFLTLTRHARLSVF